MEANNKALRDAAKVYAIVEMEQECNSEKRLTDTVLFVSREDALANLHERYDAARSKADSGSGVLSADYSEDGWYAVVDKDGDLKEGYLSEGMEVRGAKRERERAEPVRNCDKFRDVDGAYNQFMVYVKRENPACVRASPLYTVWDALKWVLGFADGDSGEGRGNETAVSLKYSPTTQEDCRWVVCSYGHLLPPWCGDDDAPVRKFTGAEFARMIRDNYDLTYARNALAAHYAEDGIGEVWNRHLGDAIGDGFNWTLNKWVEGLSFSQLEGCAGKKRKEGV